MCKYILDNDAWSVLNQNMGFKDSFPEEWYQTRHLCEELLLVRLNDRSGGKEREWREWGYTYMPRARDKPVGEL